MVIALLILIVAILLFGAGAVKGWIRGGLAAGFGFAVIATALIWVGSFFGENGFLYVCLAIGGLAVLLLWGIGMSKLLSNPHATPMDREHRRDLHRQFAKRKD